MPDRDGVGQFVLLKLCLFLAELEKHHIKPHSSVSTSLKAWGEGTPSIIFRFSLQHKRTWIITSIRLFGNWLSHWRNFGRKVSLQSNMHALWIQITKQKFKLHFKRKFRGNTRGVDFHSSLNKTSGWIELSHNKVLANALHRPQPRYCVCFLFYVPLSLD